jgi:hypothetical protein
MGKQTTERVIHIPAKNRKGKKAKNLDEPDLIQFHLRRAAVNQSAVSHAMIQEGYKTWAEGIKKKYKIKGLFDIHPQTGEVVLREKGK